jgi:hypothetical protein
MINTARLKELVEQALLEDKKKWDDDEVSLRAKQDKHREDWVAKYGPEWDGAADKIKVKVAAGEPIVREDLPASDDGWRDRPATYVPLNPGSRHERDVLSGKATYKAPRDLLEFRRFLDLVEGDTVSSSALKQHGLVNLQQRILQFLHDSVER